MPLNTVSTVYVLGTVLGALHALPHSVLPTALIKLVLLSSTTGGVKSLT